MGIDINLMLNDIIVVCGSVRWYMNELDYDLRCAITNSDHAASDMISNPGFFMLKAKNMKFSCSDTILGTPDVTDYLDSYLTMQPCVISRFGDVSTLSLGLARSHRRILNAGQGINLVRLHSRKRHCSKVITRWRKDLTNGVTSL